MATFSTHGIPPHFHPTHLFQIVCTRVWKPFSSQHHSTSSYMVNFRLKPKSRLASTVIPQPKSDTKHIPVPPHCCLLFDGPTRIIKQLCTPQRRLHWTWRTCFFEKRAFLSITFSKNLELILDSSAK